MTQNLTFTILGCGNSTGVPIPGNRWGDCDPKEPKNRRMRCSLMVQSPITTIIIDTGADFREQMNKHDVQYIDAVFYTHMHGDHTAGIDDLRAYKFIQKENIELYASPETLDSLRPRYNYIFEGGVSSCYPPLVNVNEIYDDPFTIDDIRVVPFQQDHGTCKSTGFRFGDTAYSVDIYDLDDRAIMALKGVKTWIVDAAGYHNENNKVHANLKTIYSLNEQIGAEKVILTSLSVNMDYQTLKKELPAGYEPAYDGMIV